MVNNSYDLVIYGNLVLPGGVAYHSAVGIKDGKIVRIGDRDDTDMAAATEKINAEGSYVLPGAVDAHVHCYSSLDEGFYTASAAAAAGGVTTIIEMPYDATGMICTLSAFEEKNSSWNSNPSLIWRCLLRFISKMVMSISASLPRPVHAALKYRCLIQIPSAFRE